jgi:hypothetical protein
VPRFNVDIEITGCQDVDKVTENVDFKITDCQNVDKITEYVEFTLALLTARWPPLDLGDS